MEVYNPVKLLKSLCIEKIFKVLNTRKSPIDTIRYFYHVFHVICLFQKLQPSLSNHFMGFNSEDTFGEFLWFLYHFIWNSDDKNSLIIDHRETVLTNWVRTKSESLCKIYFVGCEYSSGNLYFCPGYRYGEHKLNKHKLSHQMVNYKYKLPEVIKNNHPKSLKLIVVNRDFIDHDVLGKFPIFLDTDRGILFDFFETLRCLDYPAFVCKAEVYDYFFSQLIKKTKAIEYIKVKYSDKRMPNTQENHLRILKIASYTNVKKDFKRLCKALKQLNFLEEIELNLLGVSTKHKKAIIRSLNKNLISLKLVFLQPINLLLYVGKQFKNLQKLEVSLLASKQSSDFDKFNKKSLNVFKNLKSFKLYCNWLEDDCPFLLNTILVILNGCQKTLTDFKLEAYKFSDIDKIVKFICSKTIPLKCLCFKYDECLSNADVMKIANYSCDELKIEIKYCKRITLSGITASKEYISQNYLKKEIIYKYVEH